MATQTVCRAQIYSTEMERSPLSAGSTAQPSAAQPKENIIARAVAPVYFFASSAKSIRSTDTHRSRARVLSGANAKWKSVWQIHFSVLCKWMRSFLWRHHKWIRNLCHSAYTHDSIIIIIVCALCLCLCVARTEDRVCIYVYVMFLILLLLLSFNTKHGDAYIRYCGCEAASRFTCGHILLIIQRRIKRDFLFAYYIIKHSLCLRSLGAERSSVAELPATSTTMCDAIKCLLKVMLAYMCVQRVKGE